MARVVDGEPVRPQDIKSTALLTIEGELDDISGAGQTAAAHDFVHRHREDPQATPDRREMRPLRDFSGRRWRDSVYPELRDFIRKYRA
jgi:poly(3-hydroxybutyrate) depolymerase